MKRSKNFKLLLILLVTMFGAHAAFAQSPLPPANSAKSSPKPDIRAANENAIRNACADAAEDLKATKKFAEALDAENGLLKKQLETANETAAIYKELNETRKAETDALRETIKAKNETIAAQAELIATHEKLAEKLKKRKPSLIRRIGDVLLGAAIFAVLR